MAKADGEQAAATGDAVAAYKRILQRVLENRPSGTRQRLAAALEQEPQLHLADHEPGLCRADPGSAHLDTIFEICHFSPEEKKHFLEAYGRAHPRRLKLVKETRRLRSHTLYLPDLGDEARNRQLEKLVATFITELVRLI